MIYVHVPFCRSFCTYCDFYSRIPCKGRDAEEFSAWQRAIAAEIRSRREEFIGLTGPHTLYFGGGTPSALPSSVVGDVVASVRSALPAGEEFEEFTFEVNPEDIVCNGEAYVRELMGLGVSRFSMGVQSLDDGLLRWMNRRHDAARAEEAFRILRAAGADNISVDVIFGIAGFGDDCLLRTLDGILGWAPEHVSAYQLTLAEDSALGAMAARGEYCELPDEDCARQYELICSRLSGAGYVHYEVSNWALPGREAVHNSAYWTRRPYIGLGPAAHSFRILPDGTQLRSWNSEADSLQAGSGVPWTSETETLSPEDIRVETVMLALRTAAGLPEERLRSFCDSAAIDEMLSDGRLERVSASSIAPSAPSPAAPSAAPASPRLRIPEDRLFVSESIIRDLL